MQSLTTISEQKCWGGVQGVYQHASQVTRGAMRFALYRPPQCLDGTPVPVLWFLSGLTCNEDNFAHKAGAQQFAAQHGLMLVAPDTSPRTAAIAGENDSYDIGTGAGFYVDATAAPWSEHYRMYSYIRDELAQLVTQCFPVQAEAQGIMGHSMGGHGALLLALRNPQRYRSVSAFAPICAPTQVTWGRKALSTYLGADEAAWRRYDSVALITDGARCSEILVDQGDADSYLADQLRPDLLAQACQQHGQLLQLNYRAGYDHSYYFIATFIAEHIRWHAQQLLA